jgi:hypothetical protein
MNPAQAPAFQVYARDLLADSRFIVMSQAARGAFFTLILHAWLEGDVPGDAQTAAALLREQARAIERTWPEIVRMFEPRTDGRLVYPPHEEQRANHAAWRAKSRAGGLKSGENRRAKGGSTTGQPTTDDSSKNGSVEVEPNTNTAYCDLPSATCNLHAARERDARAGTRDKPRGHDTHATCDGRFSRCVPAAVHAKLSGLLAPRYGGDRETAKPILLDWYPKVWQRLPAAFVMGDAFKFWQSQFDADFADQATTATRKVNETRQVIPGTDETQRLLDKQRREREQVAS